MSGLGQRNNLGAQVFALPLRCKGVGSFDAFKERVGPHNASNADRPEVIRKIEKSRSVLQSRNFFADVHSFFSQFTQCHFSPLHSLPCTTEQLWKVAASDDSGKRNSGLTLRGKPDFRQTAESFRTSPRVTTRAGTVTFLIPANDNTPPWHPLDAA